VPITPSTHWSLQHHSYQLGQAPALLLLCVLAAITLHIAHCILAASGVTHEQHLGDALLRCQVLHQKVHLLGILVQAGCTKALQQAWCRVWIKHGTVRCL
jgi:hypothetical protein